MTQEDKTQVDISKISDIQPPAGILPDGFCEWDSMLDADITRDKIDPHDLEVIQKKFADQYGAIRDSNQKILFRQFFALQHKINQNLLNSQMNTQAIGGQVETVKKAFHSHNPSKGENMHEGQLHPGLRNSLAETAKKKEQAIQ